MVNKQRTPPNSTGTSFTSNSPSFLIRDRNSLPTSNSFNTIRMLSPANVKHSDAITSQLKQQTPAQVTYAIRKLFFSIIFFL